jgi:photosystem II stability/assembly factor-like uncharacterized protein
MRTLLWALTALASLVGASTGVANAATWTMVSPVGGDGTALAARAPSGTLYAIPGDRLSLYRSTDDGVHWVAATLPVPPTPSLPLSLTAAADGIYLDYQLGDVARSTDGGATWSFRKLPGRSERLVPGPGNRIYVVLDRRVDVSTDGLATVHRLSSMDIDALAVDPRGGLWAITGRGPTRRLRHSADGRTWTAGRVIPERRRGTATLRAAADGTVYATFGAFRTFRTRNAGRVWLKLTHRVLGIGPGRIVYGSAQTDRPVPDPGFAFSRNRGSSWTHPADRRLRAFLSLVVPLSGDSVLIATGAGTFRSDDGGRHVVVADAGFGHTRATDITEARQGVALLAQERGLICCVGATVTTHAPPARGPAPDVMLADRSTGIVYSDRGATRDLGGHWRRYNARPLVAGGGRAYFVKAVEQFRRRQFMTMSGTAALRAVGPRLSVSASPASLAIVPGALVGIGVNGHVLRSTNGGRTWHVRPSGAPACGSGVAAVGNVVYIDAGDFPCTERTGQTGVWRSDDGGRHFHKVTSVTGTHVAARPGEVVIADGGTVRTSADGSAWDILPELPNSRFAMKILLPGDGRLLVLDDDGTIWQAS